MLYIPPSSVDPLYMPCVPSSMLPGLCASSSVPLAVCLSPTVNSDLHFNIASDGLGGCGRSSGGFAYLWAGARATWGVKGGRWVSV